MPARPKPTHGQFITFVVIILLIVVNLFTVIYYRSRLNTLKKQSSFVAISQNTDAESFKQCLKKAGIVYNVEGEEVKVREVEQNHAVASCS